MDAVANAPQRPKREPSRRHEHVPERGRVDGASWHARLKLSEAQIAQLYRGRRYEDADTTGEYSWQRH